MHRYVFMAFVQLRELTSVIILVTFPFQITMQSPMLAKSNQSFESFQAVLTLKNHTWMISLHLLYSL